MRATNLPSTSCPTAGASPCKLAAARSSLIPKPWAGSGYSDSPRGAYFACTGRICFALD